MNVGKDPGVSRFEIAIGFSVEASAELCTTSSNYIEKRSQLLKEMIQIRNLPPPPKKKPQNVHFAGKNWKPAKYWQKIKKCRLESGMEPSVESSV